MEAIPSIWIRTADGLDDGFDVAQGWDPTRISGIRRVNAANISGTENGLSWATAFTSIQAAMATIDEGEIWVAAGHYTGAADPVVTMRGDLHLYGGFAGTENSRAARDWTTNKSIIDGENARRCVGRCKQRDARWIQDQKGVRQGIRRRDVQSNGFADGGELQLSLKRGRIGRRDVQQSRLAGGNGLHF